MDLLKQTKIISGVGSNKKENNRFPLLVSLDYCMRYRPLFDKNTFDQEMDLTQGAIVEFLPNELTKQYRQFEKMTKFITITFWVTCLGFAGLCHRIKWLNRVLGEKSWKMLTFKIVSLVVPYLIMEQVMPSAGQEEIDLLFEQMKGRYRQYKYTGDILTLNDQIQLVGPGLGQTIQQSLL